MVGVRPAAFSTAAVLLALVAASTASASQRIGLNASGVSVAADGRGKALVTFRSGGRVRRLLAWGAVNARAPHPRVPQVKLRLRYVGGRGSPTRADLTTARGSRGSWPAAAPPTVRTGHCRAGSGCSRDAGSARRVNLAAWELRLSHWRGALPEFVVKLDWAYRRYHHLYGWYSYGGQPIFGFRVTRAGRPLDGYARNVYLDTRNSIYGRGWRREGAFLSQRPSGNFCWGFFPREGRPPGHGDRYRATVIGPGVMPDMFWESPALGAYDRAHDQAANDEQRQLAGNSRYCRPNCHASRGSACADPRRANPEGGRFAAARVAPPAKALESPACRATSCVRRCDVSPRGSASRRPRSRGAASGSPSGRSSRSRSSRRSSGSRSAATRRHTNSSATPVDSRSACSRETRPRSRSTSPRSVPPIAQWEGIAARDGVRGPLLDDALAWIECAVEDEHATGDHTFFVARVERIELGRIGDGLVYREGSYHPA